MDGARIGFSHNQRAARIGVRVRSGSKPHMASLIEVPDSQVKTTARDGVVLFWGKPKEDDSLLRHFSC